MEWTFGTFLWSMLVFFFWFAVIWMFIGIFADILRRRDISGWAKAGWILLIVVLPLLGMLIYVIARPKEETTDVGWSWNRPTVSDGTHAADEIAKAAELQAAGKITAAEFEQLKQHALSYGR
jgi:predicted membrane channel-forming protein YqfA (hemolysin III family)